MKAEEHDATVYVDGSSLGNPGPAGIGIVIERPGHESLRMGEHVGETTNNAAEYRALVRGLEECERLRVSRPLFLMDSELVFKQMRGEYRVKHGNLLALYGRAQELVKSFEKVGMRRIDRKRNKIANNLAQNAARAARG